MHIVRKTLPKVSVIWQHIYMMFDVFAYLIILFLQLLCILLPKSFCHVAIYLLCLIFFCTCLYVWSCTDSYSLFVSGISLTLDQVCVFVCCINKNMYVFVCCDLWLESLQLNVHLILTLCFFGYCSGRCLVSMQIKLTRLLRRILRLESWILLIWSNGCWNLGSRIFRTRAVNSSSYISNFGLCFEWM